MLAPYACAPSTSRGRRVHESPAADRDDYQRDRDRIVHSSAFRRLVYKTQVFLNHEGDLFRTRLTHSLEVAQLARSMARNLRLNEDLTEALALAHDLGHTPFGHAGQDTLNECMADHGGFEHNLQSLRVVDWLERRYAKFPGLNLCFETREGILKHCSRRHAEELEVLEPGGVAARFLVRRQPSLEAQLSNLADELAYCAHDIDDGVRSGLLPFDALVDQPLLGALIEDVDRAEGTALTPKVRLYTMLRRLLQRGTSDLVRATTERLRRAAPDSLEAVRDLPPLVGYSPEFEQALRTLKSFLFAALYRHPEVEAQRTLAQRLLKELFAHYVAVGVPEPLDADPHRAVADYLAGMTDRFAIREHRRITGERLFVVD
ncbi:deoxyguanosinetriphosphate triphosphohydrolase [Inhella gelatinilytica]|uniref:Deoxyguanosinetriphosphate triphosphohydrolase-like protein n=1 Tax=Inhella gelatinilytica TaxID=2795030 RepID=A0A931IWR7_9BURK|nr:deoxyguanosinetriphosphate triphosphohydrolase [Inhella gelatinilytica]MBH9552435.1 deoxyguanosinetriphosphate triphosphohydrolase [Inhella gelatinilytica]